MDRRVRDALVKGAVAGLLAGALVALWFLVFDLLTARAFRTPARLAAVYLGEAGAGISPGLVLGYTALHFGVFAALGSATAGFLAWIDVRPSLPIGLALGVGVLTGLYYTGLLVTGVDAYDVVPTGQVVAANVAGGVLMMEYLRRALVGEPFLGLARVRAHPLLMRAVTTGLVGAGAVAIWFFVLDLMARQPFYTPAALGTLFLTGEAGGAVEVSFGVVAVYTVLHVAAFLIAGAAFSWAAERVERYPSFAVLALMAFIVLEAVFVPAAGLAGDWLMKGALAWWAVGVGNLLAVAGMGWWTWRSRPELRRSLGGEERARGASRGG